MRHILLFTALLGLASCSSLQEEADQHTTYPKDKDHLRQDRQGHLSGDDSGYSILGKSKDDDSKGGGIGVNSFLWRATLDTISFMPIVSADPFGGVIITDWYEDPAAKGERFKANITILDNRLRADGIRVALFKQKLDDKSGWRDETVSKDAERDVENTILTRARELRVKQTGK